MCIGWCLGSITFGIIGSSISLFGKLIPWGPTSTGKYFTTILFLLVLLGTCFIDNIPIKFIAWPKTILASDATWRVLAIMRVFLGLFSYHLFFSLLLIKVDHSEDPRAIFQNGFWPIKLLALATLIIGSFFVPPHFVTLFSKIAWPLAFLYLVVQGVLFIDLIYNEAEKVVERLERAENNISLYVHVVVIILLYLISLALMVFAIVIRNANSIKVVSLGWLQVFLQAILLLLSVSKPIQEANEQTGIYQSGLTCIYSTIMLNNAFAADSSEDYNGIMSTFFLALTLVYAAYNVGLSSQQLLDLDKETDDAQIHYNMSFFNLIFAIAAAYAMLVLSNWSYIVIKPHRIILGTQSLILEEYKDMAFYSKVFSSFSMSLLYGWSLVAPLILPDRQFM